MAHQWKEGEALLWELVVEEVIHGLYSTHTYISFKNVSTIGYYGGGGSSVDQNGCVAGAGGNMLHIYLDKYIDPYALIRLIGGSNYTGGFYMEYM